MDQGICATPHSFSQLITSFFASESLGIPHAPLIRLRDFILLLFYFTNMSMNSLRIFIRNAGATSYK